MNKPTLNTWSYAIILAAMRAQDELRERNLDPDHIRRNLTLLRWGREVYYRLQGQGVQLPEIDLSNPEPSPAAAPAHVESLQPAIGNKLHQNGRRKA